MAPCPGSRYLALIVLECIFFLLEENRLLTTSEQAIESFVVQKIQDVQITLQNTKIIKPAYPTPVPTTNIIWVCFYTVQTIFTFQSKRRQQNILLTGFIMFINRECVVTAIYMGPDGPSPL